MTLKVAGVGAGYFAQYHYEAWQRMPDVALEAVCDHDADRARVAPTAEAAPVSSRHACRPPLGICFLESFEGERCRAPRRAPIYAQLLRVQRSAQRSGLQPQRASSVVPIAGFVCARRPRLARVLLPLAFASAQSFGADKAALDISRVPYNSSQTSEEGSPRRRGSRNAPTIAGAAIHSTQA